MARVVVAPFDLPPTMAMQNLGRFDPSVRRTRECFQKVHLDGAGRPVVWHIASAPDGLVVQACGAAADDFDAFVTQFPLDDGADSFRPDHPALARLARRLAGLRLLRVPWLFDVAAGTVLQQRVRWQVAFTDFRRIAERWGTATPAGTTFPCAATLAALPVARLEAAGLDPKRARALGALARAEANRPFLHSGNLQQIRRRLLDIPGIGPWTVNTIAGYGLGDCDAVPVGDLHLPSLVCAGLAGEADGSDQRMLELLEPWRGQRFRVVRLLEWSARHRTAATTPLPP
jgi:3-methyladenine DNA glycosylase/8-oxoguanine DNA glycosylase